MVAIELKPEPLTADAFKPFGEVIEVAGHDSFSINQGTTARYDALAEVDIADPDGRPILSIFRAQPRALPLPIEMMERHPLGSQAFMPLGEARFLVLVAPAVELVKATDLRAFVTNGRQGVNFRRGIWHHPLLALDRMTDFLVVDRGGPGENCDEVMIDQEVALLPPGHASGR